MHQKSPQKTLPMTKPKSLTYRIISWSGVMAILLLIIFMIFRYLDNRPQDESPLPPPIKVSVSSLLEGSITPSYEFIGEVRAKQLAQLSPEINSVRILSIEVDVGDKISKGDILAHLDNQSLIYQKEQAQSDYDKALDEYNRKSRLGINGGISQEELSSKQIALKSAKARLDDAKLMLSKAQLTSPVDGIVIARNKDIGTLTSLNEAMFTVAVNQETEFVANIPENQLTRFAINQEVSLSLSGHNSLLKGKIRRIEPLINNTSRTANIYISFDESQFHPIGLFGTARINLAEQKGIIAPTTSILLDEKGQYLWTVNNKNRVEKIYVKEILRQDTQTIIELDKSLLSDELNSNQYDLTKSKILLRAGSLVNEGDLITPQPVNSATKNTDLLN
ncbi:efflux RND transporter periplasmic adaptor subunit [Thorsellia kenyensis]|uniref:Efflux RND transporter periplasmic adaptor subunit n=1 Tax=Thorsellia kenyensis TaxID=1549888 RepID=A0ABV6C841_9GAMM